MWSFVRVAFIWWLMLAIPIQGIAASAMLHCGPGHERQMQQAHAGDHHGGDHEAGAAHDRQSADSTADADADADTDADAQPDPGSLGKYKCSACAQCCTSVALLDRATDVIRLEPMSVTPTMTADRCPQVAQTGPERPPRSFLA